MTRSSAAIVPAYNAASTVGEVVRGLRSCWPDSAPDTVIVVDDGSRDDTSKIARRAGALVICHGVNRGKGTALRTGLRAAQELGFSTAVTVDADGQHPPMEAARIASHPAHPGALVLGIRDLPGAGAPRANQWSNRISNYFLSSFTSTELQDTQCGLRRYPVAKTLELDGRSRGYAFEAEIILIASRAGLEIVQLPVRVRYEGPRITHFHAVRDPARIIARVLFTLARGRIASEGAVVRPSRQES